ncbi:MAG: J domain-containing protein [Fibrobacterales bacterium]
MVDYYKLLGIAPDAIQEEIHKAYRDKSKQYHPDKVATLGVEIKQIASSKMLLINDAYRTLGNSALRLEHDAKLLNRNMDSFYIVCRKCGHSFSVDISSEAPQVCVICNEEIGAPSFAHDRTEFDWKGALAFLQKSHEQEHGRDLPSSMHVKLDGLFFTLDRFVDGRFCFFTHFKLMHQQLGILLPRFANDWDSNCDAGFTVFSSDVEETAEALGQLEKYFTRNECEFYINSGERKNGFNDPNVVLISAILDVAFPTAVKLWKKSDMNLLKVKWNYTGDWKSRINKLYDMIYGKIRQGHRNEEPEQTASMVMKKTVGEIRSSLQDCLYKLREQFPDETED